MISWRWNFSRDVLNRGAIFKHRRQNLDGLFATRKNEEALR